MTQDPYGRPPGSGYVVRGEVVPDDEANVTPPTVPETQFQKVASALRDRDDAEAQDDADTQDDADRDATRPEEVVAVRSPDARARDYWDDADTQDPTMTQPDLYGTAAREETDTGAAGATAPGGAAEAFEVGAAEPEAVGRHASAPVQEGLRPGETDSGLSDFSDLTYGSLLPDAAEFKVRWQQVQFRFVDDPQGSVTEAADVIAQVIAKLEAAIQERQRAIAERQRALRGRWSEGKSTDTESLRETLLMYRVFLNQLAGPKDG
jgi:hypothetical protein